MIVACLSASIPRIYIAGPMTGLPGLNFEAFRHAAHQLRAAGHVVVNPTEINLDPTAAWSTCMRADIAHLVTCNAMALLPGWECSRGATLEHRIARALQMDIRELGAWLPIAAEEIPC
ncbi:DUF4406 domain-containing protein [Candidimonas humi]|uniref:DUF4406 domain-containing protein n=1 Tax=Candidimonas humi TaxID=683355 RepID=A0ABV8NXS5_9BURK|nr:DUF4406 domain-containing protein [Candidimonas humi]MBV6304913.1 DUF4406 domain-containing protein [Candidimonas humi]